MNTLYIKHKLTAYHLRRKFDKARPYTLAICSCGWKPRWLKRMLRRPVWESFMCFVFGHEWDETIEVHSGPIDFEESEDTLLDTFKQCEKCYKVENI